jgi:hypothetical protein
MGEVQVSSFHKGVNPAGDRQVFLDQFGFSDKFSLAFFVIDHYNNENEIVLHCYR